MSPGDDVGHKSEIQIPKTWIDGSTRLVGLLGWPVAHSLSPRLHNAAFGALDLNYVYVPLPVPPSRLEAAVRGLVALGFAGANVTVPHKSAVLPFLDELTAIGKAVGAVNTLVVRADGTLLGDNTDGAGFLADLRAHGVEVVSQRPEADNLSPRHHVTLSPCHHVLVLGAGGAARAVVYALAEAGARVAVANRTLATAEELCQTISDALRVSDPGRTVRVTAHRFPEDLAELARAADLVVNATSLGLHREHDPLPWDPAVPFRPGLTVYDLVYLPGGVGLRGRTPFLAMAEADGARAIDGLGMLIQQGARAFELWTGRPAPEEVMASALA